MLKAYVKRDVAQNVSKTTAPISAITAVYCPEEDGLRMQHVLSARLDNSKLLVDLKSYLCYLKG